MPELPEVELTARMLRRRCAGAAVQEVHVLDRRAVKGQSAPAFERALEGATLGEVARHGKHLLVDLHGDRLLWVHLGMTGKLLFRSSGTPALPYTRVHLALDRGELFFTDPRLLGGMSAGPTAAVRKRAGIARLGPDALGALDAELLRARLGQSRAPLKAALMDQARLAGLGNIQACEALFRARLSPLLPARDATEAELVRLAEGISASLRHTLDAEKKDEVVYLNESKDAPNPFLVYGREGEPCPRCGEAIARRAQGGRGTYFCPRCQGVTSA